MKNILLAIAVIITCDICNAQTVQSMSAIYYEIEGTIVYDIKGCQPGSDVVFYSEKYGGKHLKALPVNGSGNLLIEADGKFKPAFVLNTKHKNSNNVAGSGIVVHFTNKEFVLDKLNINNTVNGIVLSWDAAFNNAEGYIFEILKSSDGGKYEQIGKVLPSSNSVTPYAYNDPASTKASYKIRIFNKGNGVDYTSHVLNVITNDNIMVYPTSANDHINIAVPSQYIGHGYSIINSQGQVVQSGKLEFENNMIKIPELSAGSYFIYLSDKKQIAKFIKL